MARDAGRPEPPTVVVLLGPGVGTGAATLREVLAGLEEEGVPAAVEAVRPGTAGADRAADCLALAERAAERSSLEVGVGIAADGACLTHRALPRGSPLERAEAPVPAVRARRLGHDAARLVTGLPLKRPDP